MASFIYNGAKVGFAKKQIDWDNDDFYVALVTDSYTPDQDNHEFFSDITNEITGGGYTAGGNVIANTATSQDDTNDRAILDGDDVQFTSLTNTFRYGIVYQDTGTPATSRLLRCIDLESGDVTIVDGTYDISWTAAGVISFE